MNENKTSEGRKSEHVIEAYLDVPFHSTHDSYGCVTGRVEGFRSCNRVSFEADDINDALTQAVVHALKQWASDTARAEKFTLRVHSKYGPPIWKIEVDNTW